MVYSQSTLLAFKEFFQTDLHKTTDTFVEELFNYAVNPKARVLSKEDFNRHLQSLVNRYAKPVQAVMKEAVNYLTHLNLKDLEPVNGGKIIKNGGRSVGNGNSSSESVFPLPPFAKAGPSSRMAAMQLVLNSRNQRASAAPSATAVDDEEGEKVEEEIVIIDSDNEEEVPKNTGCKKQKAAEKRLAQIYMVDSDDSDEDDDDDDDDDDEDNDDNGGEGSKSKRPRVEVAVQAPSTSSPSLPSTSGSTSATTATNKPAKLTFAETLSLSLITKLYSVIHRDCPIDPQGCAGVNLSSVKAHRRHLASVHRIGSYQCHVRGCSSSFNVCTAFVNHTNQDHPVKECAECGSVFKHHSSLYKHYRLYHMAGRYGCEAPGCPLQMDCLLSEMVDHWQQQHPALLQMLMQKMEQKEGGGRGQEEQEEQGQQSKVVVKKEEGGGKSGKKTEETDKTEDGGEDDADDVIELDSAVGDADGQKEAEEVVCEVDMTSLISSQSTDAVEGEPSTVEESGATVQDTAEVSEANVQATEESEAVVQDTVEESEATVQDTVEESGATVQETVEESVATVQDIAEVSEATVEESGATVQATVEESSTVSTQ